MEFVQPGGSLIATEVFQLLPPHHLQLFRATLSSCALSPCGPSSIAA